MSSIQFSTEQAEFVETAANIMASELDGLFLTAPAGYGKSQVISEVINRFNTDLKPVSQQEMKSQFPGSKRVIDQYYHQLLVSQMKPFDICAPTGKASILIGGTTIFQTLGLTPNSICEYRYVSEEQNDSRTYRRSGTKMHASYRAACDIVEKMKRSYPLKYLRLLSLKVLIMDEVSMISKEFFTLISQILKYARENDKLFGGIKLILVGDLCQLPPVPLNFGEDTHWLIESVEYKNANVKIFQFTICFRQSDPQFQYLLSNMRFGKLIQKHKMMLVHLQQRSPDYMNGAMPTVLSGSKNDVSMYNDRKFLEHVNTGNHKQYEYTAQYTELGKRVVYKAKDFDIEESITLCIGALIIVTRNLNIERGIVNGTQGIIVSLNENEIEILPYNSTDPYKINYTAFTDPFEISTDDTKTPPILFKYMPVALGYASTVHKAQGMTLDVVDIDFRALWNHGIVYTAISRCRSIEGLRLFNIKNLNRHIVCESSIKTFYDNLD